MANHPPIMPLENCIHSIEIIESRLSKVSAFKNDDNNIKEQSSIDYSVNFSTKMECQYQHLLAEAYYTIYIHIFNSRNSQIIFPYDKSTCSLRCITYGKACLNNAYQNLPAVSSLRLLCAYSYCKYISDILSQYDDAIALGTKTFNEACLHTNQLEDESALKVLQKIRDEFMNIDMVRLSFTKLNPMIEHAQPTESKRVAIKQTKVFKAAEKKIEEDRVSSDREIKGANTWQPLIMGEVSEVDKGMELVKRLNMIISLAVPVIFETLTSSNAIFKALDQIFRVFIRGNALPGQQSGGRFVDMDGRTVSFRSFVLNGPFMSWKGFVNVMMQFGIARVPATNTPTGRSYSKSVQAHVPLGNSRGMGNPPIVSGDMGQQGGGLVDMVDAAALFIESSRSLAPLLVLTRYAKVYSEIAEEVTAEREKDPWQVVADWANISDRSSQKWEITAGLNFMQFVDCLGKCGVVAYSGARFREILPSHSEKVEHFFSAYLGLSDTRKWFMKVDARLKFIKNLSGRMGKVEDTEAEGSDTQKSNSNGALLKPRAASAGRR